MMHALGRAGFQQSYTYFTWRNTKEELEEYFQEVSHESPAYFRPNFFVNTPDILHESLQTGGPGMFAIRAILAATLAPSWGVYSGFELFEDQGLAPGSEEYLDSEKYQLRPRDFDGALARGRSLQPLITTLNGIRRRHPALQQMKGLWFHGVSNDNLLCYSRRDETSGDVVIVVVCLDSRSQQWGETDLSMPALGLDVTDVVTVTDELSGEVYQWGQRNAVGLDPHWRPAHVLTIRE
jgi:starch synthase (maltosyl-transferring)